MKTKNINLPLIGWREYISLPQLQIDRIKVKIDTGARTSALHAFDIEIYQQADQKMVKFKVHPIQKDDQTVVSCTAPLIEEDRKIGSDQTLSWRSEKYLIDGGTISFAGYLAIFRTDLRGKTRVFVHGQEVQLKTIKEIKREPSDRPKKTVIELDPLLYIKMYRRIIEVNNAAKLCRVTGKPLKISKNAS